MSFRCDVKQDPTPPIACFADSLVWGAASSGEAGENHFKQDNVSVLSQQLAIFPNSYSWVA